jgi:pectate lyase C
MHQRCMTKHFVSSLALFAVVWGLSGCSDESPAGRSDVDRDEDNAEKTADGGDSSPRRPDAVEDDGGDGSRSNRDGAAALRDAARPGASDRDGGDDDDDGDGDDDGDDDDDDEADAGAKDASARDASASRDAAAQGDASATRDGGSTPPPPPQTGKLTDTVVNATIVVKAGMTFDGSGKRFLAGSALGDGSQAEGQQPIFKLEDGAKVTNIVIGAPAADGIHTYGDAILENIVWQDIGEDALTIKESGVVELRGGSAINGDDKVFQVNAASTFRISDFKASNAGKFIRQNGGTTFKVEVFIDKCDISKMDEAVFRTDSKTSTVSFTNSRYSDIGDMLFVGVSAGNIVQMNNTEY